MTQALNQVYLNQMGTQSQLLSKNPQVTFFKVVQRRVTLFAIDEVRQQTPNQTRDPTFTASRSFDLIKDAMLEVVFPTLTANAGGQQVAWTRDFANILIKKATVQVQSTDLSKQDGIWFTLYHQLTLTAEKKATYNLLIGNTASMLVPKLSVPSQKVYIPLDSFWFAQRPGMAIPLVASTFHDIIFKFELEDLSKLYVTSDNVALTSTPALVSFDLWLEGIHLDDAERNDLLSKPLEYLYKDVQQTSEDNATTKHKLKINFTHCVTELVVVQIPTANTAGRANRWTDFTNSGATLANAYNGGYLASTIGLQIYNQDRIQERDPMYFNYVQPYRYHTGKPEDGVFTYSFALSPESIQPSGWMNYSKLDNCYLEITNSASVANTVFVYGPHWQWLRFAAGLGGKGFSN